MPKAIVTIQVQDTRRRHELQAGELTTIGRGGECAIQVRDPSVSREHCVAVFTGTKVCVNDLASTQGIVHAGARVGRCELEPGGSLLLGGATLVFERIDGATATAPAPPAPAASPTPPTPPPVPRPEPSAEPASESRPEPVPAIAGDRISEAVGARNAPPRSKTDKATRVRIAAAGNSPKARMARFASELVVFAIVAVLVIAALLALKVISPDLDIYRLIGR